VDEAVVPSVGQPAEQAAVDRLGRGSGPVAVGHRTIVGRPGDGLCHSRRVEFTVLASERNGRTVVSAAGELDVHTAPALQAELSPRSQQPNAALIVDLTDVGFIDSTGLGVLVTTLKHVREAGGTLDVVVTSSRVLKVFALTGLDVVIPLHSTLDEALASA
jgi:anti-sigma B factor antagonist